MYHTGHVERDKVLSKLETMEFALREVKIMIHGSTGCAVESKTKLCELEQALHNLMGEIENAGKDTDAD